MDRDKKGTSIHHYVDDYSVVDLETTGIYVNSSKIIEISALKVRQGKIVEEFSTLVNPLCHIPEEASAVNHITDDMVENAPTLDLILDSFLEFVEGDVILGYNNAGFDMNMIYDACCQLKGIPFENNYIDLLHSARRCLKEIDNHRLETICRYYSVDTTGEHRALKDCYLTKECYDRLFKDFGNVAFERSSGGGDKASHQVFTAETLALKDLQNSLEQIIRDGKVSEEEFVYLKKWTEYHRDLQGNYPFDRVFNAIDCVLEDGIVTEQEREELQELFSEFVDPVKNKSVHENVSSFEGKHICVTGEFEFGSRNDVSALIVKTGGIVDSGVKKATNYLVVGAKGSENWKTGNYGGKILKAMEMNEKGADIKILEENDFISATKDILGGGV